MNHYFKSVWSQDGPCPHAGLGLARSLRATHLLALLATSLLLLVPATVQATTVTLSTHSSDETLASVLDATLGFETKNGGNPRLILSVTNDTTAPDAFDINEVYFNASSDIGSLSLDKAQSSTDGNQTSGWTLHDASEQGNPTTAGGFGVFSYSLLDGVGGVASLISPGETMKFTLKITSGTAPYDPSDFDSEASSSGFLAAARFANGPGDDSAFGATVVGATVPEPGTGVLLALGLSALGVVRRRR